MPNRHLVIAQKTGHLDDFRLEADFDRRQALDPLRQAGDQPLRLLFAGEHPAELVELPAEPVALLDERHGDAALGQIDGGLHAGDAPADDQCLVVVGQPDLIERRGPAQLAHRAGHQADRLGRGPGGIVLVDPGTLLADIDLFVEIWIQTAPGDRAAEGGLVQRRTARRHDHPVQLLAADVLLDRFLAGVGT